MPNILPTRSNLKIVFSLVLFFGNSLESFGQRDYVPRVNYGQKLEPQDRILLGAGQSSFIEFANFAQVMGQPQQPAFYMDYLKLDDSAIEMTEEIEGIGLLLEGYQADTGLQLGLNFSGLQGQVIDGSLDTNIETLARLLRDLDRPVWLRVGYEVNGFWNDYPHETFPKAFNHIASKIKAEAENVAILWSIYTFISIDHFMRYYPGDENVDWWSCSILERKLIDGQHSGFAKDFFVLAHEAGFPVFISESTPRHEGVHQTDAWGEWYERFFDLVADYQSIKAFSYINRSWDRTHLEGNPWRDARLEANPQIAERFRQEMSHSIWTFAEGAASMRSGVLNPINDATVAESGVDSFGPQVRFRADSDPDPAYAIFQFDISGLSSNAQATFYVCSHGTSGTDVHGEIYLGDHENWDEASVPGNTPPRAQGLPLATFKGGDSKDGEWDACEVTDQLRARILAGQNTLTLVVKSAPGGTPGFSDSRESPTTTNVTFLPAQLLIQETARGPLEIESYRQWQLEHQLMEPQLGAGDRILSRDGFPNRFKYALGLSPWEPVYDPIRFERADGDRRLLRFPGIAENIPDASLILKMSTDLNSEGSEIEDLDYLEIDGRGYFEWQTDPDVPTAFFWLELVSED